MGCEGVGEGSWRRGWLEGSGTGEELYGKGGRGRVAGQEGS